MTRFIALVGACAALLLSALATGITVHHYDVTHTGNSYTTGYNDGFVDLACSDEPQQARTVYHFRCQ